MIKLFELSSNKKDKGGVCISYTKVPSLYKITITFNNKPLSYFFVSALKALLKLRTSIGNWPSKGPTGGAVLTSPAFATKDIFLKIFFLSYFSIIIY